MVLDPPLWSIAPDKGSLSLLRARALSLSFALSLSLSLTHTHTHNFSHFLSFSIHLRLVKAPRRVPFPMGNAAVNIYGLLQPKSEGHSVLQCSYKNTVSVRLLDRSLVPPPACMASFCVFFFYRPTGRQRHTSLPLECHCNTSTRKHSGSSARHSTTA